MFLKEYRQFLAALCLAAALFCIPAKAVTVSAAAAQPTFIGNTVAGKTYRVTASGVADLFAGWNGQGLLFSPNGKPTYSFPAPYAPFFPNGLDYDPSSGPTAYGVGGPQKLYGSLLGTFSASPQGHSDFFMMGDYYVFTASSSGALYARINDCCFWDNAGSFEVSMVEVQTATVGASATQPVFIGNVVAGKSYRVMANGIADIGVGVVGPSGQGLPFTANGRPTRSFPAPYAAFFPNGLDYDPASGPNAYGLGGPQKLYGSLLGTLSASPQSHSDYFMMGDYYVFKASFSGALYARINDCCIGDNAGGYEVSMVEVDAVTVSASATQPVFIGNVVAGKTYRVMASGVADIGVGWNGQGLPFTANGRPTRPFQAPYAAFLPNGLDYDPASGPTAYGVGGPQKLYGSLIGSFTSSPQVYADFFMIGDDYIFTAGSTGALYAMINDCCYNDNVGGGGYEVSMSEVPSPGGGETIQYSYDAKGRLVKVERSGGVNNSVVSEYVYDKADNRQNVKVTGSSNVPPSQ